jgi:hypothetical protein
MLEYQPLELQPWGPIWLSLEIQKTYIYTVEKVFPRWKHKGHIILPHTQKKMS